MSLLDRVRDCTGFEWDDANSNKNWYRHEVTDGECEQVFFNQPLLLAVDQAHSFGEERILALGKTDSRRKLFVVLTIRDMRIRVISARDMTKREREAYHRNG